MQTIPHLDAKTTAAIMASIKEAASSFSKGMAMPAFDAMMLDVDPTTVFPALQRLRNHLASSEETPGADKI